MSISSQKRSMTSPHTGASRLNWREEVERALPNDKVGTVLSVTAQTLTTIIGFGILALPSAISYVGWIAGPILLLVFFFVTVVSNYLLVSVYQVNGRQHATYGTAVRNVMKSERYATVVNWVQLLNIVIVLIACSITGGMAIQQTARHICFANGKSEEEIYESQSCLGSGTGGVWQAILIFTGAELVLSLLIRTLSGSTLISLVGMVRFLVLFAPFCDILCRFMIIFRSPVLPLTNHTPSVCTD